MYLLYADESGSISDPQQRFFVLAGFSVFERETHWIEQELDQIASRFEPANSHSIELHGSPMRSGSHGWTQYRREDRETAIIDALTRGIRKRNPKHVRLFGAVLEKAHFPVKTLLKLLSSKSAADLTCS